MPKNIGNFVGFSTDGWTQLAVSLPGIWNLFDQARNKRVNRWPGKTDLAATGGTFLEPGNGFKYHVFVSPGNFVVANAPGGSIVDVLIVAGGGGAGVR